MVAKIVSQTVPVVPTEAKRLNTFKVHVLTPPKFTEVEKIETSRNLSRELPKFRVRVSPIIPANPSQRQHWLAIG